VVFREPLEGLSVRDIDEPEIFNVFFGDGRAAPRGLGPVHTKCTPAPVAWEAPG